MPSKGPYGLRTNWRDRATATLAHIHSLSIRCGIAVAIDAKWRMTDTATSSEGPRAKRGNGRKRDKALGPVLVSGSAGCDRAQRAGSFRSGPIAVALSDAFASEHRRSPRTAADAEHTRDKTEMLQLKLAKKRRDLVRQTDVDEWLIALLASCSLRSAAGLRALRAPTLWCGGGAEAILFELRTEIANACQAMAYKNGEPPLSEQG